MSHWLQHSLFHIMTATCKEKHQLQTSRFSTSSKAGIIAQHSKVGRRLSGMDISVMIPVSEEQEYLGLALKLRLTAEFIILLLSHQLWLAKCSLPPRTIQTCGEWLPPLLLLLSVPWILVTAWPTFSPCTPACWYHTGGSLHSVLHTITCTELLTWLSTTGTSSFYMNVCKLGIFLWSVTERHQKVQGTAVLQPQAGLHDGPRAAGLPPLLQW